MREQHSLSQIRALTAPEAATPAVSIKSALMNVMKVCHSFVGSSNGNNGMKFHL